MQYVIIQDTYILGTYCDLNIAINEVLDNLLIQLKTLFLVHKKNPLTNVGDYIIVPKIVGLFNNSKIIKNEFYFDFNVFHFLNAQHYQVMISDEYKYTIESKQINIKELLNATNNTIEKESIKAFIPSFTLETETNFNEIKLSDTSVTNISYPKNDVEVKKDNVKEVEVYKKEDNVKKIKEDLGLNIDISKMTIDEINQKRQEIKNKRKELIENIKEEKRELIYQQKKLAKKSGNNHVKKLMIDKEKEKFREAKNVFEANKNVYYRFKNDIEDGDIEEKDIPMIFRPKYVVYKMLDTKGILGSENEFDEYYKFIELINKKETELYKNIKGSKERMLDNVMENNLKLKSYEKFNSEKHRDLDNSSVSSVDTEELSLDEFDNNNSDSGSDSDSETYSDTDSSEEDIDFSEFVDNKSVSSVDE